VKKIPTLFRRNPDDLRHLLPEVTPGCEWVLAGEGIATRKYDGTCVLIRRDGLAVHGFARREVKPDREPPPNWVEVDRDEVTGKRVGWEPVGQSSFAPFFDEALARQPIWEPGTYELCGPKINGNPERYEHHRLIRHSDNAVVSLLSPNPPDAYRFLRDALMDMEFEGIVWHHPDGRMAKLKRRDFA
jgi:hypothetical protein